jgi:FMN phosphatase YigB (HAD superfamily)
MKTIIFDFYNTLFNPQTGRLFDGTTGMLRLLNKQYKLVLITSGGKYRYQLINKLSLFPDFSQIIICKIKKADVYAGFISSNSVVIGDRIEEEIKIGKYLGAKTLLVNPDSENPITTIKRFLKI